MRMTRLNRASIGKYEMASSFWLSIKFHFAFSTNLFLRTVYKIATSNRYCGYIIIIIIDRSWRARKGKL